MLLTALTFTCGIANAQTPAVTCDQTKLDSLKLERTALIKDRQAVTDPAKKKEYNKKARVITKDIKNMTKACIVKHKAERKALKTSDNVKAKANTAVSTKELKFILRTTSLYI